MKKTFYIQDKTACNPSGDYIDEDGNNVRLQSNAEEFLTREAAQARAAQLDPEGDWAYITEEVTRYYAVLAADLQGPAYGIGTRPEEAYEHACESGFETGEESDTETCQEITEAAYIAIQNGNPDAWELIS